MKNYNLRKCLFNQLTRLRISREIIWRNFQKVATQVSRSPAFLHPTKRLAKSFCGFPWVTESGAHVKQLKLCKSVSSRSKKSNYSKNCGEDLQNQRKSPFHSEENQTSTQTPSNQIVLVNLPFKSKRPAYLWLVLACFNPHRLSISHNFTASWWLKYPSSQRHRK